MKIYQDDLEGRKARINYAARFISEGRRPTTRQFDTCFEMNDGEEVYQVLLKRAVKNPKLAANIHQYLNPVN